MEEKIRWEKWYNQYLQDSASERKMSFNRYKSSMTKGYEKYKAIANARRYGKKASYSFEEYISERNRYYETPIPGEKNVPRRIAMEDRFFSIRQEKELKAALKTLRDEVKGKKPEVAQDILESVRKGTGISEAIWEDIYKNKRFGATDAHESAAWMLFRYLIGDEYEYYTYEESE